MTTPSLKALEVRPYRCGDELSVLRSLHRSPDSHAHHPGSLPSDLESWRWRFDRNPAGRHIAVGVDEGGAVAAHWAALPQVVDTDRGTSRFAYAVDQHSGHSLDPATRDALVACPHDHPVGLTYSFATAAGQPQGIPAADGLDRCLRDLTYLVRPTAVTPPAVPRDLEVVQEGLIPSEVDQLYRRMLPDHRCMVRRDRAYLHWRYVDVPSRREYEIWTVRRRGALVGLMVLRPFHELVPGACSIVDWLAEADDPDTAAALVAVASHQARMGRRPLVLALFPESSAPWRHATALDFTPQTSGPWAPRQLRYRVAGTAFDEGFLRRNWFYTLGDSDLA